MNRISLASLLAALAVMMPQSAFTQTSDFAMKKNFQERYSLLEHTIDSTNTTAGLDSLKPQLDLLELDFGPHSSFLDKALYPETYAEAIAKLRTSFILTYDRVFLIEERGITISELETKINVLTGRLDTLTTQRDSLFAMLEESKKSLTALREAMKRLSSNLQAKDRLIFALVDSIFLPYGKDLNQMAEVQKEAISRKLERANVVSRVYDIASDNVKFLDVTQLQAKDYANLIDQYQQFKVKWDGLNEKMSAVAPPLSERPLARPANSGKPSRSAVQIAPPSPGSQVDSVIAQWHAKLLSEFWSGLQKEFTSKEIPITPFANGQQFAASVRAYVDKLKTDGQDPTTFVDEVWKDHIDRDWRDALSKEGVLGRAEYAALDAQVSELSKETVDLKFVLYIAIIVVLLVGGWWFFIRKPKALPEDPPPAA